MKTRSPLVAILLATLAVAVAVAGRPAASAGARFVKINGPTARARVAKVLENKLNTLDKLTPADVDGKLVTAAAAEKAEQTDDGFTGFHRIAAQTYVAPYRTVLGNAHKMLVTVSEPYVGFGVGASTTPPKARHFVARDGRSGKVVARGYVTAKGEFTWTRGKNGDGLPERNLAD